MLKFSYTGFAILQTSITNDLLYLIHELRQSWIIMEVKLITSAENGINKNLDTNTQNQNVKG
jgi:hypothetical protein